MVGAEVEGVADLVGVVIVSGVETMELKGGGVGAVSDVGLVALFVMFLETSFLSFIFRVQVVLRPLTAGGQVAVGPLFPFVFYPFSLLYVLEDIEGEIDALLVVVVDDTLEGDGLFGELEAVLTVLSIGSEVTGVLL